MKGVINGKEAIIGPYGCHNRKPFKETIHVQDGWTEDGRRNMVTLPFNGSMNCKYAEHGYSDSDWRCADCKWINQEFKGE